MERKEILQQIEDNTQKIKKLKEANRELTRQNMLLSDNEQWFTEKMETIRTRQNGKIVMIERLIGKIHYNEAFKDEDTGETIIIERCDIVRVDGNWNW